MNDIVETLFSTVKTGPRGGDLNNPKQNPEARRAEYNGNESRPHNSKPHDTATPGYQKEQPWHTMAAYMLCAGRTNSEIAMAAGVLPVTVSHLRSNRWFQELCARIANVEGQQITGLIAAEAAASLEVIVTIRDDESAKPNVRLSAAVHLLEQANGKPRQQIIASRGPNVMSPEEEMVELNRELEVLRKSQPESLTNGTISTNV